MRTALLLFALCGPAWASCERIEYADARDWPIAKAEEAYCDAKREMYEAISAGSAAANKSGYPRDAAPMLRESNACAARSDLFARVIENVHKRPLPKCKL